MKLTQLVENTPKCLESHTQSNMSDHFENGYIRPNWCPTCVYMGLLWDSDICSHPKKASTEGASFANKVQSVVPWNTKTQNAVHERPSEATATRCHTCVCMLWLHCVWCITPSRHSYSSFHSVVLSLRDGLISTGFAHFGHSRSSCWSWSWPLHAASWRSTRNRKSGLVFTSINTAWLHRKPTYRPSRLGVHHTLSCQYIAKKKRTMKK